VLTDVGPVEIAVPRDREGSFEPQIVKKRQRRLTGVDEMALSLSAKGLTTGDISAHLAEVYGAEVSRQTISTITDKVMGQHGRMAEPAAGRHLPDGLHRRDPREDPGSVDDLAMRTAKRQAVVVRDHALRVLVISCSSCSRTCPRLSSTRSNEARLPWC
jgi:hypothetical protein